MTTKEFMQRFIEKYIDKFDDANTDNVFENTLHCGSTRCPAKQNQINWINNPPSSINKDFSLFLAKFSSSLLYPIERADITNTEIKLPKIFNIVENIKQSTDENEQFYCTILTNNNNIYICVRGLQTKIDGEEALELNQKNLTLSDNANQTYTIGVQAGFLKIYESVITKITNVINKINGKKDKNILIIGHSLGATTSVLLSIYLTLQNYNLVTYTFGSPRIGDEALSTLVDNLNINIYNILNVCDLIPTLPYSVSPYFDPLEAGKNPFIYKQCGNLIYFKDNWKSIMNNHLLPVYMDNLDKMGNVNSSSLKDYPNYHFIDSKIDKSNNIPLILGLVLGVILPLLLTSIYFYKLSRKFYF